MAQTSHFNVTLTQTLADRIALLAEKSKRSKSGTMRYLVKIGLSLPSVPPEWGIDKYGAQVPTGQPVGTSTSCNTKRAIFLAPVETQVAIDNFRSDNDYTSFSHALRVLLSAAFYELDRNGCDYCRGEKP